MKDQETPESKKSKKRIILGIVIIVLAVGTLALLGVIHFGRKVKTTSDIQDFATRAFYYIPDHAKVSSEAQSYMTAELYELLVSAYEVPRWPDGEIGNEEFLYYFITGNDPSDKQKVQSVVLTDEYFGTYTVNVNYLQFWQNCSDSLQSTIQMVIVRDNGKLLIDDFGDGVKAHCKRYIRQEISDFLSGETYRYMKEHQTETWYTDQYITKVKVEFNDYISKYSTLLEKL